MNLSDLDVDNLVIASQSAKSNLDKSNEPLRAINHRKSRKFQISLPCHGSDNAGCDNNFS